MFQAVNLNNRVYNGSNNLLRRLEKRVAILDYDDLVVEIIDTALLPESIVSNMGNYRVVETFSGSVSVFSACVKKQLTSPIISWEFEDSINEVININLLGVGHTISVRKAKFFDCVSFDDVMLLHCERTPSIGGICLDYAFSIGGYLIIRMSLYTATHAPGAMFSLVFRDAELLGCYTTWVSKKVELEPIKPIPSSLKAMLLMTLKDKY